MFRPLLMMCAAALPLLAQTPPEATPEMRAQVVQVKRILINGTRLPKFSVIALMRLKAGDNVNDAGVIAACHRLSSTGLVKSVDYQYTFFPDQPGAELVLTVVDEPKLVPATIEPQEDSAPLWAALKAVDPLFTETLPPNEHAIAFYARNLDACLKRLGRSDEYVAPKLQGKAGEEPSGVIFHVLKYKK